LNKENSFPGIREVEFPSCRSLDVGPIGVTFSAAQLARHRTARRPQPLTRCPPFGYLCFQLTGTPGLLSERDDKVERDSKAKCHNDRIAEPGE